MSVWLSASDDDGNDYRKLMASHGRDHATQLVLAVGLGASAFLAFCVRIDYVLYNIHGSLTVGLGLTAKMGRSLCCAEEEEECGGSSP